VSFAKRAQLIHQLQDTRKTRVVTYITGDRNVFPPGMVPFFQQQLASDAQIVLYDQLRRVGKVDNLDLFLYTRGGEVDSVWPLVNLFREYAHSKFSVLVPFRAHSGGTMICLGADEVVMGEMAELSPIDPTTGNLFNPQSKDGRPLGISVEDVTSYMGLAVDKFGLKDSAHVLDVFKELSRQVHPLALGNVNRVHTQIRILARKLLGLHLSEDENSRTDQIVNLLTEKLYSHTHALNRKETKEAMGNMIVEPSEDEEGLMWQIYEDYAQALGLKETFCVDTLAESGQNKQEMNIVSAFIETAETSFSFEAKCIVRVSSQIPPNVQVQIPPGQPMPLIPGLPVNLDIKVVSLGWKENKEAENG
jgi:hypothetical protein